MLKKALFTFILVFPSFFIHAQFGAQDSGFLVGTGANNVVQCSAIQSDGKIIVGGYFGTFAGTVGKYRIVRLNEDGTLDPTFADPGLDGAVMSIAIEPSGEILIGGYFTSPFNYIGRLSPNGSFTTNPLNHGGVGYNNFINSIAVQTDGKIVVGGGFTQFNGVATGSSKYISRLNANGSLDAGFLTTGTGFNNSIQCIALQSDGKIVVGGLHTSYNGNATYKNTTRLLTTGAVDATFTSPQNLSIYSLAIQPDGKILYGMNAGGIKRCDANGGIDGTFSGASVGTASVFAITVQPDGKVLVGSDGFPSIKRLTTSGLNDGTFNNAPSLNLDVNTIVVQPNDGKIIVGGAFTTPTNRLIRLLGTTASVYAGPDQTSCGSSPIAITASLNGVTGSTWVTSGNGTFGNPTALSTSYTPSANDITAGKVTLTYKVAAGQAVSSDELELTINSPAAITIQPVSTQTFCEGATASISLAATGTGITYQWFKGGTPLTNGGTISGSTSNTLGISTLVAGDAATYTCTVMSGGACTTAVNSSPSMLNVNPSTSIFTQPLSQTKCAGDFVSFNISAGGTGLTYQWKKGGTAIINGGAVSGANSQMLIFSTLTPADAGNYTCDVVGTCGTPVTSSIAILTITPSPSIITQPASSQLLCEGTTASMTVVATGAGLTYQWYKTATPMTNGGRISGAMSANLSISNLIAGGTDNANYTCDISGTCGPIVTTIPSTLNVNPAVNIFTQPVSQTKCESTSVSFSVSAGGVNLSYQWKKNGVPLTNGGTISGVTTTNLLISSVVVGDAADYTCDVTSSTCGSPVTSTIATLTVNPLPAQPAAFTTSTATVTQSTSGVVYTVPLIAGVTYNWSYTLGTGATINGSGNSITVDFSSTATSGILNVTASNVCGGPSAAQSIGISVNASQTPQPGNFIVKTASVCDNQMGVPYSVPNVVGVTYTWSYSGTGVIINGSTNAVTVDYSVSSTPGTLSVTANDGSGPSISRDIAITVNKAPIIDPLTSFTICENTDAALIGNVTNLGAATTLWTSSGGAGIFADATQLTTAYTPSLQDKLNGFVFISLQTVGGGCPMVSTSLTLTFTPRPKIIGIADVSMCSNASSVSLNPKITGATGGTWSSTGGGTFSPDVNTPVATYSPTAAELLSLQPAILTLTSTGNGTCNAESVSIQLTISNCAGVDPGLAFPSTQRYAKLGDPAFKTIASSASNGAITYSIVGASSCVSIHPTSGLVSISCVENVQVLASQAASGVFQATTAVLDLIVLKADPNLLLETRGGVIGGSTFTLNVTTPYDGTIVYTAVGGDPSVATVAPDGTITPLSTGVILVRASTVINGSVNYGDGTSNIVEVTIYPNLKKPIAENDTLVLTMAAEISKNIVANDYGTTNTIQLKPMLVDIDAENAGVQNKFFKPGIGVFTVDDEGIITFIAFDGFLGTDYIEYTVTDADGQVSEPAKVFINILSPVNDIALKGNEVITPNNDNLNDALVIGYTDLRRANDLLVVDDAGNRLYFEENYQNDWHATDLQGNNLGNGVYYYIFREFNAVGDVNRSLKGYFTVIR